MTKYSTHIETLTKYVQLYPSNVIELGAGYYSTPIIGKYATKSESIENNKEWLDEISEYFDENHTFTLINSWADFCPKGRYSLAFVDHADEPDHQRWIQVLKLIP